MARSILERDKEAILEIVHRHSGGVTAQQIAKELPGDMPLRTLQYRIKQLVMQQCLVKQGSRRWTTYHLPVERETNTVSQPDAPIAFSNESTAIRAYVRQSPAAREPVGYHHSFLDAYQPGINFYLSLQERTYLAKIGKPPMADQPAGTYAKQILHRLLIDLSWNSSRLEGNTYSLLDTKRLIQFGNAVEGRDPVEAQMILNHKDAIEFLVGQANDIGFNRFTILNLHAMLANNLLANPRAQGQLRYIPVGIERSTFYPLEVPQLIAEYFEQILMKTAAINDPFEQALFFMVQLPYLQPFDDVNRRVSRMGANIPLIKHNLVPLSFTDVPRDIYTEAVLGVYEMNRIDLLKDLFIWAYERSVRRYTAVRQSLGAPDPFRLTYRDAIQAVVGEVVRGAMGRKEAIMHVADYASIHIEPTEQEHFREVVEDELLALHAGNFARYQIRPSEFDAWQRAWGGQLPHNHPRSQ